MAILSLVPCLDGPFYGPQKTRTKWSSKVKFCFWTILVIHVLYQTVRNPLSPFWGVLGPNFAFFLIFYVTQGLEGILGTFIFTKLMILIKDDNFLDFDSFDLKF